MMTGRHLCRSLLLGLAVAATGAHAGGPLVLEGPSGNTPVRYNGPIGLNFDQGPLLNGLTNTQADNLLLQAVGLWNAVSTATVQINQDFDLPTDIDVSNYSNLLPSGAANDPSFSDDINPVIYDADGQIIDDYFGVGQSDDIAGFASSIFAIGGTEFIEGYAVLNGKASLGLDGDDVITLVTHEIGHLIGLDHSQLDINNGETVLTVCTSEPSRDDYPMMYPFLCRTDLSLHEDDEIAVSALYPVVDIDQQFGQLRGFFVDAGNTPILGANLWAEETTTGARYSIISDYRMEASGFFGLYLPPGRYTLHANSINPLFFNASSVGPYANNQSDVSFSAPNPITPVSYQAGTGSDVNLDIVAGEAVEVTFRSDASGSDSGGAGIIDLGDTGGGAAPTGGSSGSLGPLAMLTLVLALLGGRCLRPSTRPTRQPR